MQEKDLTPAEMRLVQLMRQLGYGKLIVEIRQGQPCELEPVPRIRLDKQEWPGAIDLLQQIIK